MVPAGSRRHKDLAVKVRPRIAEEPPAPRNLGNPFGNLQRATAETDGYGAGRIPRSEGSQQTSEYEQDGPWGPFKAVTRVRIPLGVLTEVDPISPVSPTLDPFVTPP